MSRNRWVTDKVPMASWMCTLSSPSTDVVRNILSAGAETEVFVVPPTEGHASSFDDLHPGGRVAFFDSAGRVREEFVSDLGQLLESLEGRTGLDRHYVPQPPVAVMSTVPEEIWISLYSDTWFPALLGLTERDFADRIDTHELIDNRALSARHTPRLNRFIEKAREVALSVGAQWELDSEPDPIYQVYFEMCSDRGIRL